MNFRLNLDFDSVLTILNQIRSSANKEERKKRIERLLQDDQLHEQIRSNKLLLNFSEATIDFIPTYKMEPFAEEYKAKKTRTPSW